MMVVFEHEYHAADHDIYGQKLDASGNKVGAKIPIRNSALDEIHPDVAASFDATPEYVDVWQEESGTGQAVRLRRWGPELPLEYGKVCDVSFWDSVSPAIAGGRPNYLIIYEGFSPGVVTGKPLHLFGSDGREEATGRGVAHVVVAALEDEGRSPEGVTVAIQGFGNVGSFAATTLAGWGAKIVAVGDHLGGVARADGLDVESLAAWVREHRTVKGFPDADEIDPIAVLTWECDVLIPAAIEDVLTEENAGEVRASLIAEAANAPTTPEADEILLKRGVKIIPDILANAGGVTVSYFEWAQNIQQYRWELDRVRAELAKTMSRAYNEVQAMAKERRTDMRTAAFALAIQRVGRAAISRGQIRREIEF